MSEEKQIEAIERELAARLGTPLEQWRAQRAHCPPLAAVRALSAGTMPEAMQASLQQHVESCGACGAIAADLQDDELTAPTAAEAQRIAARVAMERNQGSQAAAGQTSRREHAARLVWGGFLRPILALAAVLIAAVVLQRVIPNRPTTAPVAVPPTTTAVTVIPEALRLAMPEVHLRVAIVLHPRGEKAVSHIVKDLAPALDAYRAKNYADAAQRFADLESKYPQAVELLFYSGISQLALGQHDAALGLLERAARQQEAEFAIEIDWYRALAEHRAGKLDAARARLRSLCKGKSEFTAKACEAAQALDAPAQ